MNIILFGGERRKERSWAQSSPPGGGGVGGVSSDDMGGALAQSSLVSILPRPKGNQNSHSSKGVENPKNSCYTETTESKRRDSF